MPATYYLAARARDIRLRVEINGVPLINTGARTQVNEILPLNLWLQPSDNGLTVEIAAPADAEFKPGSGKAEVSVFLHDPGEDMPTPKETLASFKWPGEGLPPAPPVRKELSLVHDPVGLPPLELWSRARRLGSLDEADQDAILGVVESLRRALLAKDLDRAFQLLLFKYRDLASADGKPLEKVQGTVVKTWEWMLGHQLMSSPLTKEQAGFELLAGGRLVRVTRIDAPGPIYLYDAAARLNFCIEPYFAKIDGAWAIVR